MHVLHWFILAQGIHISIHVQCQSTGSVTEVPLLGVTGILSTKVGKCTRSEELQDSMTELNEKSKISIDIYFISLWQDFQEEMKHAKLKERGL